MSRERRLNFGSGLVGYKEGWINADWNDDVVPDVVADLSGVLPFASDTISRVFLNHVLEHFREPMRVLEEIWRVCSDKAQVMIVSPHPQSKWAWGDPDHKSIISPQMMGFLRWPHYDDNIRLGRPMTQSRPECDYDILGMQAQASDDEPLYQVEYLLQVVKPIRNSFWTAEKERIRRERINAREARLTREGRL